MGDKKAVARSRNDWICGIVLFAAVLLTYSPVWWAGYVWDDDILLTANPVIVGHQGLWEIWTTSAADVCPLTLTTFWVEHQLWGLAPLPYHVVNVLLHGIDALLLWIVLRRLLVPGAWLGAALWALHPVQVESVAWIAEMKNTESGLFFLLSILFFLKWLASAESSAVARRCYFATLIFGAMAMACKSSTVVLPIVLVLCAWWMERKRIWRTVKVILPLVFFAVVAGVATMATAKAIDRYPDMQWVQSWPERLIVAGDSIWFYLGKLAWPFPLMANHPRWHVDAAAFGSYVPLLLAVVVGILLWWKRNSWARGLSFAFGYYAVALLPVLGLFGLYFMRFSFVAYHFQYLAAMGPLALIGAACAKWTSARVYLVATAALSLVLGMMSWERCWAYQSEEALWADTLYKNPESWLGHNNFGKALFERGDVTNALEHFRRSIQLNPNYDRAHNNLGMALLHEGQVDDAVTQFQQAISIDPESVAAISNLGDAYAQRGQPDDAIRQYQKALELDPDFDQAEFNWGNVLLHRGAFDEAIEHYKIAIAINRENSGAYSNLGAAFLGKGDAGEAEKAYRAGLAVDPDYDVIHFNLGNLLLQENRFDAAIPEYEKAIKLNPNYVEAFNGLGVAYFKSGMREAAVEQFQNALRLKPDYQEAKSNLMKIQPVR